MNQTTKKFVRAGIIAALYAALSLITFPIASGAIQFRISEGLTLLPLVLPEAVIGVFVGCLLANLLTGCFWIDVVFGSLVTLFSATLTLIVAKIVKSRVAKIVLGGAFTVLFNAFLLPMIWAYCYQTQYTYIVQAVFLFLGEVVSVYAAGIPMLIGVEKYIQSKK